MPSPTLPLLDLLRRRFVVGLASRSSKGARRSSLRRHATAGRAQLFAFDLHAAKVADNRRGFGSKQEFDLRGTSRRPTASRQAPR